MRRCIVAALLFWGCGTLEVDEDFVKEVDEYYFAPLEDGDLALGIRPEEGSVVTLRLRETNEEGLTPARLCLDGEIGTLLGTITKDCMYEHIEVLETAQFSQWFEVMPAITVQVKGEFAEDRQALSLWVQHIGSITLNRCNFVEEIREIPAEEDTGLPVEEVITVLEPECRGHF